MEGVMLLMHREDYGLPEPPIHASPETSRPAYRVHVIVGLPRSADPA